MIVIESVESELIDALTGIGYGWSNPNSIGARNRMVKVKQETRLGWASVHAASSHLLLR